MGCTDPSPFLNITNKMFLAGFSFVRAASLTLNFLYLTSNITFAILRLASTNRIFIEVFFHILIIARAPLLIMPYTIFLSVF